jgi:alpha-L-rhamnosidase
VKPLRPVRIEHLGEPLGIGDRLPRVSWRLPDGTTTQIAYELRLDDGSTTGRVESPDNVLVRWPGRPLRSRERRLVQVRVWTDQGESAWSEPTAVEAGLLTPRDWTAAWIEPIEHGESKPGFRPAYLLRGELRVSGKVETARLCATAHGIYEAYLNGNRIGDIELAPGYTEHAHRTQVQAYDVTALVEEGTNTLGAVLTDGWYRGEVGILRAYDQWGHSTAFLCQLHVDHPDGTTTVLGTGASWRSSRSHIVAADLIEGQAEDRRLYRPDWCTSSYDAS